MALPRPLVVFYVLAFAISWAGYVPLLAGYSGYWKALRVLPGCGPALAAGFTLKITGQTRQPLLKSARPRWYLLAFLLPWRGFATPRLQERHSVVTTALIVGILWALWHLPLFFWLESPMSGFSFAPWFLALLAESVILGWLYNQCGQNLGPAIVCHIAFNLAPAWLGLRSHWTLAAANTALAATPCRFGEFVAANTSPQPLSTSADTSRTWE